MVAFEILLSDLMGIKTFPVISWPVLDLSVDKAISVHMSLLLNLYLEFEVSLLGLFATSYLKIQSQIWSTYGTRSFLIYHKVFFFFNSFKLEFMCIWNN
jgi:hypothetical protein